MKTKMMRATAALISLALVHLSFGPEAWASFIPKIGAISAPTGNGSQAAGAATQNAGNFSALSMPSSMASPLASPTTASELGTSISAIPFSIPAANSISQTVTVGAVSAQAPNAAASAASKALKETAASAPTTTAAKPAAIDSTSGKAGNSTARIKILISQRFAELKKFFSVPNGANLTPATALAMGSSHGSNSLLRIGLTPFAKNADSGSGKVSSSGGDNAPPAPAAETGKNKAATPAPEHASAIAQRSIKWFLGGMLLAQVGVEVLGLAMPLLMRQKFGGFSAMAHIAVVSSAAGIVGRLSGSWIANKFGVKTTFIVSTLLRTASITAMAVFLMGPSAPLVKAIPPLAAFASSLSHLPAQAVLTGFYSLNSLMAGITLTAQNSIPRILLGNDRATLERFFSLQQWTLEILGFSGPKIGSALINIFGFTTAIAVYPIMLAIAVPMYFFGVHLPKEDGSYVQRGRTGGSSSTFARIMTLMAPMNSAIGGTIKTALDKIISAVDSLVLKAYLGRWIKEKGGQGQLTDKDEHDLLSRSTLGWTTAAMLSLSAFLTLSLPTVLPAYAAMVVFGVAEVVATQKLYSLIQSRTKDKAETVKISAIVGAGFAAIYTLALNSASLLFDHLKQPTAPFLWFAAAMLPLAGIVYTIKRAMASQESQGSPELVNRPKNGFVLLFKDPMMRWAFLGYSLLGLTNPLIYQILSQAFGLMIVGGSATAASDVASWITSLYSFGGLLGGIYMWRESSLISNAKKPAEAAEPQKN